MDSKAEIGIILALTENEPFRSLGGLPTLFKARADDHFARCNIFRKTNCSHLPCRGHFARIRNAPPAFF